MFKAIDLRTSLFGPVSFEVGVRECLVVRGPSGAGKSQLLRALADLDPSEGEVWLGDEERGSVPVTAWRQRVGYLQAEPAWWFETVGAHFPDPDSVDVGALGFSQRVFDWEVTRLSSGERQRLGLLRLLANQPRVLLLDEPTANLDDANTERVEQRVRSYLDAHDACALWVTHDPEQAGRIADDVLELAGHPEDEAA
jgi:ABC-type iron transport system FetAB ATPase subunit